MMKRQESKTENSWEQINKNIDKAARNLWIATVLVSISIAFVIADLAIRLSKWLGASHAVKSV